MDSALSKAGKDDGAGQAGPPLGGGGMTRKMGGGYKGQVGSALRADQGDTKPSQEILVLKVKGWGGEHPPGSMEGTWLFLLVPSTDSGFSTYFPVGDHFSTGSNMASLENLALCAPPGSLAPSLGNTRSP